MIICYKDGQFHCYVLHSHKGDDTHLAYINLQPSGKHRHTHRETHTRTHSQAKKSSILFRHVNLLNTKHSPQTYQLNARAHAHARTHTHI